MIARGSRAVPVGTLRASAGVASSAGIAVALGGLAAVNPRLAVIAAVVALGLVLAYTRPALAIHILIVSFLFQGYLSPPNQFVTFEKAIGLLGVSACFMAWYSGRWRWVSTSATAPLVLLLLWLVPTGLFALDPGSALVTSARYASFAIVYLIVVQFGQGDFDRIAGLIRTLVLAAGASSVVGLFVFATGGAYRVSGPISDPNDTAFILGSCLPFAIWLGGYGQRSAWRWAGRLCAIAIVLAMIGTLSRGALAGVVAATVWAVVAGYVRARWVIIVALSAVLGATIADQVLSAQVHQSLAQKEHIAANDVQSRLYYWNVAIDEFRANPLVGVGPGQFEVRFYDYAPPFNLDVGTQTTHNTYLNILAELGLPGLVLFLWFLAASWLDMDVGTVRGADRERLSMLFTTRVALIYALVAAFFLTEQYYAPLWLLPAIGVGIRRSLGSGDDR